MSETEKINKKERLYENEKRLLITEMKLVELKESLKRDIKKIEKMEDDFFLLEEEDTFYSYPAKRKIKNLKKQIETLRSYFPSLKSDKDKLFALPKLPGKAEGLIAVPKPSKIASSYNDALIKVLSYLEKRRPKFLCGRINELSKEYLRVEPKTKDAIHMLEKNSSDDYLIIPVQLGIYYLGRSARRSRILFSENEFGLGPFEVAVFLLTHEKWLTTEKDLGIDCVGGKYSPYKHDRFKYIMCFYFLKNKLFLNDRWSGCPDKKFGAPTGFVIK